MKTKLNRLFLFVAFTIYAIAGNATDEVKIGELYYYFYGSEANVAAAPTGEGYSGDIVIPEKVTYEGVTYTVTRIGGYAFCYEPITSISIPNSVKEIGINAFLDCRNLREVRIPASVEKIGVAVFKGCGAKNIIFEDGVYGIKFDTQTNCKSDESFVSTGVDSLYLGRYVSSADNLNPFAGLKNVLRALKIGDNINSIQSFKTGSFCYGFTQLKNVYLPDNLQEIPSQTFSNMTSLQYIKLPQKLQSISDHAFWKCTSLQSIKFPKELQKIGAGAFEYCTSLTSICLPEETKEIQNFAFDYCSSLKELIILNPEASFGYYTGTGGTLYAYPHVLSFAKGITNCEQIAISNPYYALIYTERNLSSLSFYTKEIKSLETECSLVRIEFDGKTISPNDKGIYTLTNLNPGQAYNTTIVVLTEDKEKEVDGLVQAIYPNLSVTTFDITQTSVKMKVGVTPHDNAIRPTAIGVERYSSTEIFETNEIEESDDGFEGAVNIQGLTPQKEYEYRPYAIFNGNKYYNGLIHFTTKGVSPMTTNQVSDPTTFKCNGKYTLGTATLKKAFFTFKDKEYEGNSLFLTGLDPNQSYSVTYTVTTEEGSVETQNTKFKTSPIEFTTLQPKGVSSTCSIVAATTNINEDETNVGFQWKKYDAPESLAPKEGYAAIYDGKLEGYLKNLQPTSYYIVRGFYKSDSGNYYYGDWVTFDPSDFSYFDPTVHTYEATDVTDRSAKVKGYVLAGTDEIKEQGFEYWPTGTTGNKVKRVNVTAENTVSTVLSTGQVMTATLTDLLPGSNYSFRSFVKTSSGMTYGEEQMFSTVSTGIDGIISASSEPTIIGYYDINGRKYGEQQRGINIIRYSDGSVRKIFVK